MPGASVDIGGGDANGGDANGGDANGGDADGVSAYLVHSYNTYQSGQAIEMFATNLERELLLQRIL